ncbi:putative LRR receptor-like serine/threonine-protein kinase [Hordeum vulgare]|nr:putative LRR receptor-like serine/threonine-protein kinase [Hordeum vulgare]
MKSFSYADLVKATNGFSPDNLVGSGAYGSVYKGVVESETNGMVAVKVFKLDQLGAPKSFVAECEAFRNTRHHNLVRVISACSTWDNKGNDFKALVIEYMANVHCDLKPSNVLLDDVMGARLSDFGLAKFLQSDNSSSTITSTSLAGPRGSIGYIAPEYGIGNKISTAGDAYSYGIIILEMLTGKRPTDVLFKNGLSLQKFVGNAFPEKIHEILDPNIIGDEVADHGNHAMVGMLSCIMQLVQIVRKGGTLSLNLMLAFRIVFGSTGQRNLFCLAPEQLSSASRELDPASLRRAAEEAHACSHRRGQEEPWTARQQHTWRRRGGLAGRRSAGDARSVSDSLKRASK